MRFLEISSDEFGPGQRVKILQGRPSGFEGREGRIAWANAFLLGELGYYAVRVPREEGEWIGHYVYCNAYELESLEKVPQKTKRGNRKSR